ncbi:MAG: DUF29 domain-containing protein [Candidatus Binataceae bacterium]
MKQQAARETHEVERDYYDWLRQQSRALREHRPAFLDWQNLAEELEAMARSEERSLGSQLERVLVHLLKWAYQPQERSGSWEASIDNARDAIEECLEGSPSLAGKFAGLAERAYRRARRTAGAEMGLDKRQWNRLLPETCPWAVERIRDAKFRPAGATRSNGHKR